MADRVVTYMATVFRRSDHEITVEDPMSPVGGDYLNPTPTNAFWSKTFPPGDLPLYASTRIFTSDGLFPQEADWNPPVLILKHGEQGPIGLTGGSGTNGINGLGGTPGAAGNSGVSGAAGTSIVWLGEATAHPVNVVNGNAYKNTVTGISYIYYNGVWYPMTKDGVDLERDLTIPPTPADLAIISYYAKIGLTWTASASAIHSHTEIWRSTVNDLATAVYVDSSTSAQYMDSPPVLATGVTYYYWIRFVSTSRVFGLFNATIGVAGSVANDPTYMLELLAGKLNYGQFDVANGIFPIRTVAALPALPDAAWPNNSMAFLTTDKLLYKIVAGAFVVEPDQAASRAQFGVGALAAGAVLAQSVGANEIIANSANLANAVVTTAKIADLAVDEAKIAAAAITNAKIDRASVNKLQVVTADIANAQVETLKIGLNAVTLPIWAEWVARTTPGIDGDGTWKEVYTSAAYDLYEQPSICWINMGVSAYTQGGSVVAFAYIRFRIGSTVIAEDYVSLGPSGVTLINKIIDNSRYHFTPPAGSNTFVIEVKGIDINATYDLMWYAGNFTVIGMRR